MTAGERPNPLQHERYTRSNGYDPDWVIQNQMGPNALWLLESLAEILPIEPGMKVLDLGCGKAMTSILLAREYGAQVWAADLWIPASENRERIVEAGLEEKITPVHAEAIDDQWRDWLRFNDVTAPTMHGWLRDAAASTHDMLEVDRGESLGFARLAATRPE